MRIVNIKGKSQNEIRVLSVPALNLANNHLDMVDWHNIRALQALHLHEVPPGKPFNLDLISD